MLQYCRVFVAFCIYISECICQSNVLGILFVNKCSEGMLENHAFATEANFIIYGLTYDILDHRKVKFFL